MADMPPPWAFARLMEVLGSGPARQRVYDTVMGQGIGFGTDPAKYGMKRTKQEIFQAHEDMLRHTRQQQQLAAQSKGHLIGMSSARDVKPAEDFPTPPALESLTPIGCEDLTAGTTHR